MKVKQKSNSGFTLVELIIAMAILAFLMTAVAAFMSSGVASYKKAKADIVVHNTAQEVYGQLTNSIMSANDIIICGYVVQGSVPMEATESVTYTGDGLLFTVSGEDVSETLDGPVYFVRDEAQENMLTASSFYTPGAKIIYYSNVPKGAKVYVEKMIVDNATPIVISNTDGNVGEEFINAFTGETVVIEEQRKVVDEVDDLNSSSDMAISAYGETVYNVNDTERNIFTFDENKMYYERQYAYMTKLNDYYDSADSSDDMFNYTYSKSLSYLNIDDSDTVTGCVATIDAEGGAIAIDLYFSDKNMTYTTLGMVNTRNSYVLKAKK